jgi:hypothetical protein
LLGKVCVIVGRQVAEVWQLKRLRVHGLIKRIGHRYKHYLTDLGRRAVVTGLKLRELFVLPQLAAAPPSAS